MVSHRVDRTNDRLFRWHWVVVDGDFDAHMTHADGVVSYWREIDAGYSLTKRGAWWKARRVAHREVLRRCLVAFTIDLDRSGL